jgi:tetratricopeptide (TPR) repeat protein
MKQKQFVLIFLCAIALSLILYGNTIGGEFVYDDSFFADRQELRESRALIDVWSEPYVVSHRAAGTYRPLTMASYVANFLLFGESPASFHVINIFLNGAVVFLVFVVIRKLFGNNRLAFFGAFFFAFFPIHTEAVAYIKAREEILAALFALISWLLYLKSNSNHKAPKSSVSKRWRWYLTGSSFFFLLSALSKELFILTPFLFLIVSHMKGGSDVKTLMRAFWFYVPAFAIAFALRYMVLREYAFGADDLPFVLNPIAYTDFFTRIWTAFSIAFLYVGKTFIPINLSATYHFNHLPLVENPFRSLESLAGMALIAVLLALAFHRKFRSSPIGIGAFAFLILYFVISKFAFTAGDLLAERWLYFPSFGLAIIGGYAVEKIYRMKRVVAFAMFIAVFAAYGALIISRNRVWASNKTLYESMIKDAPQSLQGHQNLAVVYLEEGEIEKARSQVEKAFAIYKEHAPLLNLIGIIAYQDGNYELAETAFLKAIEVRPTLTISYSNIGKLYYDLGEYEEAVRYLQTAVRKVSRPSEKDIRLFADALLRSGRAGESETILKTFLKHAE